MKLNEFLKAHADHLLTLADTLAIILDGLGIVPNEATKVHNAIQAIREDAETIRTAITPKDATEPKGE